MGQSIDREPGTVRMPGLALWPAGDKIVFTAHTPAGQGLFELNESTFSVKPLVADQGFAADPSFSSDGRRLVYTVISDVGPDTGRIWTCNADGRKRRRLTATDTGSEAVPALSPDGSLFVFAKAGRDGPDGTGGSVWDDWDLYVGHVRSHRVRQLTHISAQSLYRPTFSPNGNEILFGALGTSSRSGAASTLGIVDVATSRVRWLLPKFRVTDAAWSPDGRRITFVSDRGSEFNYGVWVANADGTAPRRLSLVDSDVQLPTFERNHDLIMYLSDADRDGRWELWEVDGKTRMAARIMDSQLMMAPMAVAAKFQALKDLAARLFTRVPKTGHGPL